MTKNKRENTSESLKEKKKKPKVTQKQQTTPSEIENLNKNMQSRTPLPSVPSTSSKEMEVNFIDNDDDFNYFTPRQTSRQPQTTNMTPISTQNRYSALNTTIQTTTETTQQENVNTNVSNETKDATTATSTTNKNAKIRPPPIIVSSEIKDNQRKFLEDIKKHITKGFHIRYFKYSTAVYIYDMDEWTLLKARLENKCEYHTYASRDQKTHAFILKGLDLEPTTEELQEELVTNIKLPVKRIFKLNGTQRPMYMIVTNEAITEKIIKQKAEFVLNTKVFWERHRNTKQLIQCHRCQTWCHATENCRRAPRCLKCAQNHYTKECTLSSTESPKCVNCEGPHPANSTQCPTYQTKLKLVEENRRRKNFSIRSSPQHQNQYYAAPPPKVNAWQTRNPHPPQTVMQQMHPSAISTSYQKSFPTLRPPMRSTTLARTQNQEEISGQEAQTENVGDIFTNLIQVCNEINQQTNMAEMLRALSDYNNLLKSCQTQAERFNATLSFFGNLNKYGC